MGTFERICITSQWQSAVVQMYPVRIHTYVGFILAM